MRGYVTLRPLSWEVASGSLTSFNLVLIDAFLEVYVGTGHRLTIMRVCRGDLQGGPGEQQVGWSKLPTTSVGALLLDD